jgi:hypothetical protein
MLNPLNTECSQAKVIRNIHAFFAACLSFVQSANATFHGFFLLPFDAVSLYDVRTHASSNFFPLRPALQIGVGAKMHTRTRMYLPNQNNRQSNLALSFPS